MKFIRQNGKPKVHLAAVLSLAFGALLVEPGSSNAQAQEAPAAESSGKATPAAKSVAKPDDAKSEKVKSPVVAYSPGVEELLKLADKGVSKEVMKALVESSSSPYTPTAADIIALKERGVADEVVTAMFKRAPATTAPTAPPNLGVAVPAVVRELSSGGQLDPESYDFWYYHYAYPRALSSSYRTLAPYQPGYSYRHYGPPHRNSFPSVDARQSGRNAVRGIPPAGAPERRSSQSR
jgi:hypothetical protein